LNYSKIPGLKKAAAMNIIAAVVLGQKSSGVVFPAAPAGI